MCGFCNILVCVCVRFFNVWVCVSVVLLFVDVCMCVIYKVWMCVSFGFVMCVFVCVGLLRFGYVNMWVL